MKTAVSLVEILSEIGAASTVKHGTHVRNDSLCGQWRTDVFDADCLHCRFPRPELLYDGG
jgi:hypothetical protein